MLQQRSIDNQPVKFPNLATLLGREQIASTRQGPQCDTVKLMVNSGRSDVVQGLGTFFLLLYTGVYV
jgi:hypothetical protein